MSGADRSNAGGSGNGHVPDPELVLDEEGPDDDSPLDEAEAAAAAARSSEAVDESLDERVEAVVDELGGVERTRGADGISFEAGGRLFAVLAVDRLEVALDPAVATAALRMPEVSVSQRGAGWIVFAPSTHDRFSLDRADAWVRSAHRRVAPGD